MNTKNNDEWDSSPDNIYPAHSPEMDEVSHFTDEEKALHQSIIGSRERFNNSDGITPSLTTSLVRESSSNMPISKKLQEELEIFDPLPSSNPFEQFAITKQDRERLKHMDYLIDELIPRGHALVLYGAAGSGKTTVCHSLAMRIAMERPDMIVSSLYLDGAGVMASDMDEHRDNEGLNNYIIAYNGTVSEINKMLLNMGRLPDLSNHVIIYDTFKYLTENVNCKASNKRAIHNYLKPLTKLGATIIMLHHTNKDGENYSGTAELEQDTDGMIKAESFESGDKVKTSLIKGGRCRFNFKECSFEYTPGQPHTVKAIDFIKPNENMDMVYELKDYIGSEKKGKKELIDFLMDR
ncbi:MAG: AAA family ATPase, partial [Gammaproteobacteria bacterium]|nr:AAA family ATPase [Gammaproteobacteria bacterium]